MIYLFGILLIISLFLCIKGYLYFKQGQNIRVEKDKRKQEIEKNINELSNERDKLLLAIEQEKQKYDENLEREKNKFSEQLELFKQNINYASINYSSLIEEQYIKVEQVFDTKVENLNKEMLNIEEAYNTKVELIEREAATAKARLKELQDSLSAGVQAQLREREKEENLQFYKLSISAVDLEDIIKLNNLKITLHQPVILSKLIWTQYFQKQATEMCNRILGTKAICGIYKITNLKTKQCYIGQSVNISDRWKSHIKCGLGIEASATNKLYNAMQKDGAWNFTFELIEECKKDDLNKKEAYWINMYQSDKFGYNSTKGNS